MYLIYKKSNENIRREDVWSEVIFLNNFVAGCIIFFYSLITLCIFADRTSILYFYESDTTSFFETMFWVPHPY